MEPNDQEQNDTRWVEERFAMLSPGEAWQADERRGLALLRTRREQPDRRGRRWAGRAGTWIAVGAMATCISLMATPVTRAFAQRCVSACVGQSGWIAGLIGIPSGSGASVVYIK